jgi:hypothetical protein
MVLPAWRSGEIKRNGRGGRRIMKNSNGKGLFSISNRVEESTAESCINVAPVTT